MSPTADPTASLAAADALERGKALAAVAAASLVEPDMVIGLGTGSTASLMIAELGRRLREEGLRFTGVPSSVATARQAQALGIPLIELDATPLLDLALDGADEVDPRLQLVKGRGGALLREKIVASAATRRVIMVTPDKLVSRLGQTSPVPVEVSDFGLRHTEHALRNHGARTTLRLNPDGSPYITDEGHRILDCRFDQIADPGELNRRLNALPGVFETGLFIDLCEILIVGRPEGAERIERPR
jgi:ribose 5-phosphate isomerase A